MNLRFSLALNWTSRLVVLTIGLFALAAHAAEVRRTAGDEAIVLPALEVAATATRTSRDVQRLPVRTEVLDEQEIAAFGAVSLADALRAEPSIILQPGGSFGPARLAPVLRGAGPNATLLLVDGRRLAGEVGNPFESGRISAGAIERIEIVEGPLGTLYGADAIGGVINVITRRPEEERATSGSALSGTAGVSVGTAVDGGANRFNTSLAFRGHSGRLGYGFHATFDDASPFAVNERGATRVTSPAGPVAPSRHPSSMVASHVADDYTVGVTYRDEARVASIGGRLDYRFSRVLALGFDFNVFDENRESRHFASFHPSAWRGANGGSFAVFNVPVRSVDENQRIDVALDALVTAKDNLSLHARVYRSDYRKRNATSVLPWADLGYASEAASTTTAGGNADVTIDVAEVYADWRPGAGNHLIAGADYRDERRVGSLFDPAGVFAKRSLNYAALYVQDVWDINETVALVGGARHDRIDGVPDKTTARLGAVATLRPWLVVRANVAEGFRTPDLRELYVHRQTPAGLYLGSITSDIAVGKTPHELRPESSTTSEIGVGGRTSRFDYGVTLFRNELRDRIEERVEVPLGASYRTFRNVARARIDGLEARLGWHVMKSLRVSAASAWLEAGDRDTGAALTFVPDVSLACSADWRVHERVQLGARARHVGAQAYQPGSNVRTRAFTAVDLSLRTQLDRRSRWELQLGVDNAFDAAMDKALGVDPGPYVRAGLRHRF